MKIMFLNIFLSAILCAAAGEPILSPAAQEEESVASEGVIISNINSLNPTLLEPPPGQRCSGRNYQGRRCCTPENPCDEGEGDCDGPADGGGHDGHAGCIGELLCGSNNCKQFGAYYHGSDDCCERPQSAAPTSTHTALAFDLHQTRPVGPVVPVCPGNVMSAYLDIIILICLVRYNCMRLYFSQ